MNVHELTVKKVSDFWYGTSPLPTRLAGMRPCLNNDQRKVKRMIERRTILCIGSCYRFLNRLCVPSEAQGLRETRYGALRSVLSAWYILGPGITTPVKEEKFPVGRYCRFLRKQDYDSVSGDGSRKTTCTHKQLDDPMKARTVTSARRVLNRVCQHIVRSGS